jgi:hypothetical protein
MFHNAVTRVLTALSVFNNKYTGSVFGLVLLQKFQTWKVGVSKFDAVVLINFKAGIVFCNFPTINISTSL